MSFSFEPPKPQEEAELTKAQLIPEFFRSKSDPGPTVERVSPTTVAACPICLEELAINPLPCSCVVCHECSAKNTDLAVGDAKKAVKDNDFVKPIQCPLRIHKWSIMDAKYVMTDEQYR